jgi:hypothetical protein
LHRLAIGPWHKNVDDGLPFRQHLASQRRHEHGIAAKLQSGQFLPEYIFFTREQTYKSFYLGTKVFTRVQKFLLRCKNLQLTYNANALLIAYIGLGN